MQNSNYFIKSDFIPVIGLFNYLSRSPEGSLDEDGVRVATRGDAILFCYNLVWWAAGIAVVKGIEALVN